MVESTLFVVSVNNWSRKPLFSLHRKKKIFIISL